MATGTLTPHAELAARDRALPGLAIVLDDEALAAELAHALPDAGVTAAEATYVRYKPGTACVVACRLTAAAGEIRAYLRLQSPESHDKLVKNAGRAGAPSALGAGAVLLENVPAALYPEPNDRRIAALPRLVDPVERERLLAHALPDRPELWPSSLRLLRWKPERRYVAVLQGVSGEQALVKAYAGGRFPAADRVSSLLGGREQPRTPRRLGRSRRARIVVLEWLPGAPLEGELLAGGGAAIAGAALARLHAIAPPPLPFATRDLEMQRVLRSVDTISTLVPGARPAARRVARDVARWLPRDGRPVAAHGDFSADQVLLHEGEVALVDLDDAVLSDPARDLGSFVASLWRDVVGGNLDPGAAAAAQADVVGGYGEVDRDALRAWTAAALLHLAPEPFRHREPDWPARVEHLVALAEAAHDG